MYVNVQNLLADKQKINFLHFNKVKKRKRSKPVQAWMNPTIQLKTKSFSVQRENLLSAP